MEHTPQRGRSLVSEVNDAVVMRNVKLCMNLIYKAAVAPYADRIACLCILLKKPTGADSQHIWNRPKWVEMRLAALDALVSPSAGDITELQALISAVLYDVPAVSAQAAEALMRSGLPAAHQLSEEMDSSEWWTMDGMVRAITALGRFGSYNAGQTLTSVLFGRHPRSSKRLMRRFTSLSALGGITLTALLFAFFLADGNNHLKDIPAMAAFLFFGAIACTLLTAVPLAFTNVIAYQKAQEHNMLDRAATEALIALNDTKTIPDLAEIATGRYPATAKAGACRALAHLLPLLGPEHRGLLDGPSERRVALMLRSTDCDLLLAVLHALEYAGTGQSADPVERFTRRNLTAEVRGITMSRMDTERTQQLDSLAHIQSEAVRILTILMERKQKEEDSTVLLRHSQPATASGSEMLRAANAVSRAEPAEQLLRAAQSDADRERV